MRHLPRILNRIYLFTIGALLIAVGVVLTALTFIPKFRQIWDYHGQIALNWYHWFSHTYRATEQISWAQIACLVMLLALICFLLDWIFRQGGGKTNEVASIDNRLREGTITAEISFVNDLLQRSLKNDRMITSITASAWLVKRTPGIRIKVIAAKGANIGQIHSSVTKAVNTMDSIFGTTVPVLVHITNGWMMKTPSRTD